MAARKYNFFAANWIDLSYEANDESQNFTSNLLWENLALIIIIKLERLINRAMSLAIKRRIAHKIEREKP